MNADDLVLIGLERQPMPGVEADCWVIIAIGEDRIPTVNLLAPVVINRATGLAVQAVRDDSVYSCRHALVPEVFTCS